MERSIFSDANEVKGTNAAFGSNGQSGRTQLEKEKN
jgi:hypothetical protein